MIGSRISPWVISAEWGKWPAPPPRAADRNRRVAEPPAMSPTAARTSFGFIFSSALLFRPAAGLFGKDVERHETAHLALALIVMCRRGRSTRSYETNVMMVIHVFYI